MSFSPSASLEVLATRAALLARVRAFLDSRGCLEVQTPALVRSPGVDAWLDAIPAGDLWLTTSPEYHMKRLLAAGSGPIYQLGKAWRAGERGRQHEPEFTMLEWYRPGLDGAGLMDETEALVRDAAGALGGGSLRTGARACPTEAPFARRSFAQAFTEIAGLDPATEDLRRMGRLLRSAGHKAPGDADREELVDLLLAFVVQPELGRERPEFITDWPADRAALARIQPDGTAARFELYACGVELCNGYHELADPTEQRRRIDVENRRRQALDKPPYPVDEAFLAALDAGLPDCAGNALGFDRLLMLLCGLDDIGDVVAFRVD
jgi:lysyl-tRNA synthetase class 2